MPVVAVAESQNVDVTGNLTDVYELTYTVPNKPGTFTVSVPKTADALAAATQAIADLNETVLALYAIPQGLMPFAVDEFAPGPLRTFGEPPVDVGPIYVPTTAYIVISLSQSERIRPSDQKVVPTIEVTFRVPGLSGVFTIRIDNYAFTHVDVLAYMRERSYLIRAMYALPAVSPPYVDVPQTVPA